MGGMPAFPDLRDRGVLITGGGSGIGSAFVRAFCDQGAKVAFIDIAETASQSLVESLKATAHHPVLYMKADLRDVDAVKRSVETAASAFGGLGVLVNNAGWDDRHEMAAVTEEYWDDNQAINLKQMFFAAQAAAPHLVRDGHGAIVNLSSIAFLLNMGSLPSYAAAKAGILGLTKSLAGRLGPDGVRVNAILPGMVVTERQKELWLTEDSIAAMLDRQCLKRALLAEDMVGPCLFLASSASAGMTAQSIIVDGGTL